MENKDRIEIIKTLLEILKANDEFNFLDKNQETDITKKIMSNVYLLL